MKIPLISAGLLAVVLIHTAKAQETVNSPPDSILIEHSRSPDGLKEITITDTGGQDGEGAGLVQIRDVHTGKALASFYWEGFRPQINANTFDVLWRPDNRTFAITYESTRHYVSCDVYALTNEGRCFLVKLPDIVARVNKKYGLESNEKGSESPKWLSNNRLAIDLDNRGWATEKEGTLIYRAYRATLHLSNPARNFRPQAILESIHLVK